MNFFEHQDQSRRNTKVLTLLFVLAVVAINLAVYFLVIFIFNSYHAAQVKLINQTPNTAGLWNPDLFFKSVASTCAVIALGWGYMNQKLKMGGSAVASMLGGRKVSSSTTDPHERRLLNVIEEMSIASGIPTPQIFVLDRETSINAFAAGFTISDAAIGVTKGTLTLLTRDELQGVIAHEFSHIFHGDMRLNIRLTGVLHGILCIATIGSWIAHSSSGHRSYGSSRKSDPLVLVGFLLFVIGYIGVFFGKLIKSAVSRQREFLADASAVQYTRNPKGIGTALKKIGDFTDSSRIRNHNAETMSHIFFGNALRSGWISWMATHPPLEERIKRIDPEILKQKTNVGLLPLSPDDHLISGASEQAPRMNSSRAPNEMIQRIGNPSSDSLAHAQAIMTKLPREILEAAHLPESATLLVYSLLLSSEQKERQAQIAFLKQNVPMEKMEKVSRLNAILQSLSPAFFLPTLELSFPALRELSRVEHQRFLKTLIALIQADQSLSMREMILGLLVKKHLSLRFSSVARGKISYRALSSVSKEVQVLLSAMALSSTEKEISQMKAFEKGVRALGVSLEWVDRDSLTVTLILQCIEELQKASPSLKREILEAVLLTASHDGKIEYQEEEFIRALSESWDCPIAPQSAAL